MIQVYPVRPDKRDVIPAVTHVDGSGRLQTVSRETNPRYWALIRAFGRQTGVPVLLNTSFNENEPIVLTPERGARLLSADRHGRARHGLARAGKAVSSRQLAVTHARFCCPLPAACAADACTSASSTAPTGPTSARTGQLLTELAEDLVRVHGWDVTVVSGLPVAIRCAVPASEWRHGVHIVRAAGSTLDPKAFIGRATNYLTYFTSAASRGWGSASRTWSWR